MMPSSPTWCWTHNRNEPIPLSRWFTVCTDCGHVYRSARELRRAYRRETPAAAWGALPWRTVLSDKWHSMTLTVANIHACPECTHEF